MRQVTASKLGLYLQCQRPFDEDIPFDPPDPNKDDEPVRFGLAFHEVMADTLTCKRAAKEYNVDYDELKLLTDRAIVVLNVWEAKGNPWGIDVTAGKIYVEMPFDCDTGDLIEPADKKTHIYPDLPSGHIGGTADYIAVLPDWIVVLDYKTGRQEHFNPASMPQLQALMFGATRRFDTVEYHKRRIAAILHADRETQFVTIYADEMSVKEMVTPRYRPQYQPTKLGIGPECAYCPVKDSCPTRQADLNNALVQIGVKLADAPSTALTTREEVGRIHQLLAAYDKLAAELRREIRADVVANGPAVRPDGKLVQLETRSYEYLSKSSVERALGKVKAAKELERLRKLGCMETQEREELRASYEK